MRQVLRIDSSPPEDEVWKSTQAMVSAAEGGGEMDPMMMVGGALGVAAVGVGLYMLTGASKSTGDSSDAK